MLASVILASYGDLDLVERTLAAFARQSCRDFELVVADDGSPQDYAPLLQHWPQRFAHPMQHVRHPDLGFRKARILNRAVHASRAERIIFVDMDCLPHQHFVRNHLRLLRPGIGLTGRRVQLDRAVIPSPAEILADGLRFGPLRLISLWLQGRARAIKYGMTLPLLYESSNRGVLGSNFSIYKVDLERVNGFNEAFQGMGWEDTDIDFRLQLCGVKIRNLRNQLIEYHVAHPRRVQDNEHGRAARESILKNRSVRAAIGLAEIQAGDFERKEYES